MARAALWDWTESWLAQRPAEDVVAAEEAEVVSMKTAEEEADEAVEVTAEVEAEVEVDEVLETSPEAKAEDEDAPPNPLDFIENLE